MNKEIDCCVWCLMRITLYSKHLRRLASFTTHLSRFYRYTKMKMVESVRKKNTPKKYLQKFSILKKWYCKCKLVIPFYKTVTKMLRINKKCRCQCKRMQEQIVKEKWWWWDIKVLIKYTIKFYQILRNKNQKKKNK